MYVHYLLLMKITILLVCVQRSLRASMIGADIHTVPISVNMTHVCLMSLIEESELVIYAADRMIEKRN